MKEMGEVISVHFNIRMEEHHMKRQRLITIIGLALAFSVALSVLTTTTPAWAKVREYWIAADEVLWDYAPSFPINLMTGEEFTADQRVFVEDGIGRIYRKALYRQYTQ